MTENVILPPYLREDVKTLEVKTRALNQKEEKILRKMRSAANIELAEPFQVRSFIIAILATALLAYFAVWTRFDLLTFLFGALSVLSFSFVIFMPYYIIKDVRKAKRTIKEIDTYLTRNEVEVYPATANRIAVAKQTKDEGDLYIIELTSKNILYLRDLYQNLKKHFPANEFEIYNESFSALIRRRVNPISEKVTPVVINSKSTQAYFQKVEPPQDLHIDRKNFDKLVKDMTEAS